MIKEDRYARQRMLPEIGEEGQRKICRASVLIVGLGGLGCPAALYLSAAGIGRIGLADPDIVSESNLQRQVLYTVTDIGRPKVHAAAARLSAMSPGTVFEIFPEGLLPENATGIISKYDIVIDCCDNFSTRYLIDDTCAALSKPWIHGAIGEFTGQVTVLNHLRRKRYTDLYPDRSTLCARPKATAGVLGPTAGTIGTLQASEALKLITGFGSPLDGRLLLLELKTPHTEIIEF